MSDQHVDANLRESSPGGVAIGIPAYNEAATVGSVVRAASDHAETVIVVDDGSSDGTTAEATAAGATVVSHAENRGYGAALETLFETAHEREVDHLVVVDADGQHDPADAPDLVATQRSSEADIVIGSRFVGGSERHAPLYRRVGLAVINTVVGMALRLGYSHPRVHDTQSGFRAYDADAVEMLAERADLSDGMDASVDILFHAADESCEFVEVPIDVRYDVAEANTHNPIVHGATLLGNVFRRVVSDRPDRLLGFAGLTSLLVGSVLALASRNATLSLPTVPEVVVTLLIVAGGALAGVAFALDWAHPSRD
jgi:glycosyltransferase involved in cell wall biosynthesis